MDVAETIKMIRKSRFLSQEAFAKELGLSFTTVNRWETGKSHPALKALKNLDEYCKRNGIEIDISELITEVAEK